MIMRTVEAAKSLHVTERRLIACKKEMGYKPLKKIDSRDLKKIRKHLGIVREIVFSKWREENRQN